jgi:murein DD-endopeptidase MepM/ murein hydrolase activator NlpD
MPDAQIEDGYRTRRQRALERRAGRRARAAVSAFVAVAAALALWRLPKRLPPLPRDTAATRSPAPPVARRDTIRRGEGVVAVLMRAGLDHQTAVSVLTAAETRATARRDIPVSLFGDSVNAPIREVELQIADDRSIRVMRIGDTSWTATQRHEVWRTDTIAIRGPVTGSLVASLRAAGRGIVSIRGRLDAAYALAEAFEYKLDVGRDLQDGDSVLAVVERRRTAFGAEEIGALLAGALFHDRAWMRAVRFANGAGVVGYYDQTGRPLKTTFLAAPLEFRRMSSAFGFRVHPILGTVRRHAGIDYAATSGTPVRAVGDGAVIKAGYGGGFGNMIELRHRDGIITRYGHLRGFAMGIREGEVVMQGQVIGYVGSTGLSTGPHLHFETLVNGASTEPTRTLRNASAVELSGPSLDAFARARDAVASQLGIARAVVAAPTRARDSSATTTVPVVVSPAIGTGVQK